MKQNMFTIPLNETEYVYNSSQWNRICLQFPLNEAEYFTIPSKYHQDTLKINEIKQNISLRIMYLILSNMYEGKVQKVKDWNRCLGTFQKEIFPRRKLPKSIFLSGNFPNV